MNISNILGKILINGVEFFGKCVSIVKNKVSIDGKEVACNIDDKVINVVIQGDCGPIDNGLGDVIVHGNVDGDVKTGCGDIDCKDVHGQVKTGVGDIQCRSVGGDAKTGCGDINRR